MKRGTPEHPKTYDLAEQLSICRTHAVGILELLWHFTAKYAIQGDIGKHSDQRIAEACGWEGPPQEFIQVLVAVGWLDEDEEHRLMVHAWAEHADNGVRLSLRNRGLEFIIPVRIENENRTAQRDKARLGKARQGKAEGGCKGGEPQNDKIGDGDRFNAAGDFARLREVVPRRRVAGMTACRDALVVAVRDGADVEHIIEQAKAYYVTPHAKGRFGWGLLAFIRDGHWDDDPDAWQDRDRPSGGDPTPRHDSSRQERQRAEDDAVRKQQADDPGALARAAKEFQEGTP